MALVATLFVALVVTLVGTPIVDLMVTLGLYIRQQRAPPKSEENRAVVQAALSTTSLGQASGFLLRVL